ncbi:MULTISPECIES: ferritin family protein [Thermococcus]|uniref:Rubrerythrin-related protein n=2 Tax=Thermococcus sibiricus TaxID=172049 RepID=C5ZZU2_THESM|nr:MULTISPECIES: ferritin family protein [Thermococcus]KUK29142.1 MAG: Rubrerythrin-related protein [Thermococcus sp. 40_45]HII66961.1 rubrerythrin [Thermococcaceae archaeon]ACS90923.1 Rubrerythrin-related protein [Thermococcus sibiricus MM 739]KUK18501.1 MAG: Rubrerythrin-related protein [Thermococcus sibiricus]MBC7094059.1 rubrerythrin [Thermococcus sp.]
MKEINALALALEVEKAELRFYIEMAKKAKDERAKRMFLFLAGEEAEHWDVFEKMFVEKLLQNPEVPQVDKELLQKLTPKYEGEISEVKAVELGMEQEKLTWEFYEEAAEEAEDENLKKIFRELAKVEKSHYELLKAQYDSVMKTGIWMDYQDFSLEVD